MLSSMKARIIRFSDTVFFIKSFGQMKVFIFALVCFFFLFFFVVCGNRECNFRFSHYCELTLIKYCCRIFAEIEIFLMF